MFYIQLPCYFSLASTLSQFNYFLIWIICRPIKIYYISLFKNEIKDLTLSHHIIIDASTSKDSTWFKEILTSSQIQSITFNQLLQLTCRKNESAFPSAICSLLYWVQILQGKHISYSSFHMYTKPTKSPTVKVPTFLDL